MDILSMFFILVLKTDGTLQYCSWTQPTNLNCKIISNDAKKMTSTNKGVWIIGQNGDLSFVEFIKSPTSDNYLTKIQDFSIRLKDIRATIFNQVFGILLNGSLVQQRGITDLRPFGSLNDWIVFLMVGNAR